MNIKTREKLVKVLKEIDQLAAALQLMQLEQLATVRSGRYHLSAFKACQLIQVARYTLDGAVQMLFKSVKSPHPGPNGELNTEDNISWFDERIDGLAPAVGLPCADTSDALIDAAAEAQFSANLSYQEALSAVRPENLD
ncbi:MAG: hypothetical protein K2X27_25765 [Candidatus Obscuribacterales bacterium]|nr:hypothetical protein [Candidatus Obscuribacterales bacterium]